MKLNFNPYINKYNKQIHELNKQGKKRLNAAAATAGSKPAENNNKREPGLCLTQFP